MAKILKGPELNEVPNFSLGQLFFNSAEAFHDQTCQIDANTDNHETYLNVKLKSTRVAIALQNFGVTPEDVTVLCSRVTLDTIIPIIASFYLGAKVANLDPSLSVRHTAHLLSLVSPSIIFVEEASLDLIEESLQTADLTSNIVVFGISSQYPTLSDFETPQSNEEEFKPIVANIHDIALIFFSSGTTGLPKAIAHSHYSFLCGVFSYLNSMTNLETILCFTSFYWISGISLLACCFIEGGKRIICGASEPEKTFSAIEKYKVTYIFLAPILTYKLTNYTNYRDFDTSSLHSISIGGTPISPKQIVKLKSVFQYSNVVSHYGTSETGILCIENVTDKPNKTGFYEKLCAGVLIKIVDVDTNETLGPHQRGEIRTKTPAMMVGYYNGDSTQRFDDDGFLATGDVGYYDENDCFYFLSRIKEMFKYMSWHIVPSFIEDVLLEHPAVKEAVVFGLPQDEEVGEVPAACVVLIDGSDVSEEEIADFVASLVSDRERLRGGVFFCSEILRTPTGKVMRKEIRDSMITKLSKK